MNICTSCKNFKFTKNRNKNSNVTDLLFCHCAKLNLAYGTDVPKSMTREQLLEERQRHLENFQRHVTCIPQLRNCEMATELAMDTMNK